MSARQNARHNTQHAELDSETRVCVCVGPRKGKSPSLGLITDAQKLHTSFFILSLFQKLAA